MSIFGAYMAKYCDARQHQLSYLCHMREGAQDMYMKVQAESRVPQLEKELAEARLKLDELAKEHHVLAAQAKKVPQLEVEVEDLKHSVVLQRATSTRPR